MTVKKQFAPRASNRASKAKIATSTKPSRRSEAQTSVDEDDWMPLSAAMTPKRVISEFFESDYDVM
jgi:hypothetical protein